MTQFEKRYRRWLNKRARLGLIAAGTIALMGWNLKMMKNNNHAEQKEADEFVRILTLERCQAATNLDSNGQALSRAARGCDKEKAR